MKSPSRGELRDIHPREMSPKVRPAIRTSSHSLDTDLTNIPSKGAATS